MLKKLLMFILIAIFPVNASHMLEVCPNGVEYVKVYVDSNCTLSDGEGRVNLNKSGVVYIAKDRNEFYRLLGLYPDYEFKGRFALANDGEDVYIIQNGRIVDSFNWKDLYKDRGVVYYRTDEGWDFKYWDWTNFSMVEDYVSGMVIISPTDYRIDADNVILASYTLTDLPTDCSNVTIFLDGNPVGGVPINEMLLSEKFNVTFLRSKSFKHFHWKFAVCDGCKIIITTENWKWNKRGYIVEFKSGKVADFLKSVLNHDKIYSTDVNRFSEAKTKIKVLKHGESVHFRSKVGVFVLPDCNPIFDLIKSAKRRLLIQAPYMGFEWFGDERPLLDAIVNASKRVKVRIILSDRDEATRQILEDLAEIKDLNLEVKTMDNLHGKLIVVDDVAIIASANLNKYGLKLNREVGVIIYSKDVADFLASRFDEDWNGKKKDVSYLVPSVVLLLVAIVITHTLIRRRFR